MTQCVIAHFTHEHAIKKVNCDSSLTLNTALTFHVAYSNHSLVQHV